MFLNDALLSSFSYLGIMFLMAILLADLDKDSYTRVEGPGLTGIELGVSLYREHEASLPLVIISPSDASLRFSGSAVFSIIYRSPISDRIALTISSLPPGLSLRCLGYDAMVIKGSCSRLSWISVGSDGAECSDASGYAMMRSSEFEEKARKGINDAFLSIGPAAEKGIIFSSLQSGGREIAGEGLGYLFSKKGIKGISFPTFPRKDHLGSGKEEKKARRRLERSRWSKSMRREGGGRFIDAYLRLGAMPVECYSRRFDPRAYFLDGKAFNEKYGMYPESCQDCYFACARRRDDNSMLPTWEETMALGPNLGFFSPEDVAAIADETRSLGLSSATVGAMLAAMGRNGRWTRESAIEAIRAIVSGELSVTLRDIPEAVMTASGFPVLSDLRGSFPEAIAAAYELPLRLPASVLMPHAPLGVRASALMALYESVYSLALVSEGFSPMGVVSQWWSRLPSFIYRVPLLLYGASRLFRAYGRKGKELQERGLMLLDIFSSGPSRLPDAFTLHPESAIDDARTVPYTQLVEAYEKEKERLEKMVRSRRERRDKRSSSRSAAVGPEEDRGREGDPGLTR